MTQIPSIVFISDNGISNQELRRFFHSRQRDWKVAFYNAVEELTGEINAPPPWIIAVDADVADELSSKKLGQRFPDSLRVLIIAKQQLSEAIRQYPTFHVLLKKPVPFVDIEQLLTRARILHQLPLPPERRARLTATRALPSLPSIYLALQQELDRESPNISVVAQIVKRDQFLLARLLQLVNSPFFGFNTHTSDTEVAVMRLGLATLQNLVLILETYHPDAPVDPAVTDRLLDEATQLAEKAGLICDQRHLSKAIRNQCILAALLHNIGQLVNYCLYTEENIKPVTAGMMQTGHELAGVYLLELWGFDPAVIEAVECQSNESLPEDAEIPAQVLHQALHPAPVTQE